MAILRGEQLPRGFSSTGSQEMIVFWGSNLSKSEEIVSVSKTTSYIFVSFIIQIIIILLFILRRQRVFPVQNISRIAKPCFI